MPHSLKSKVKSLCYKGEITEKERDRIIHALEQQPRDCKTCKHSDKGNCAGTEECHECMWDSKYEQQPCEDCISRKDAIKIFGEVHPLDYNKQSYIANIKKLPSVTPQQERWIPCSERLPEREGWYLTSLGDKTYGGADVDMYCKGWVKYGTHVLAWMPLPEGYKEEDE